jgi:hypothetical protein
VDSEAPWHALLQFRYGSLVANFLYGEGSAGLKHASIWWRDIWNLGGENEGGWFGHNIGCTLGNGTEIGFWRDTWLGPEPLCIRFAELFDKSLHKDHTIAMMGYWENEVWKWNFEWTVDLSNDEFLTLSELYLMLEQVHPGLDKSDRRR